MAKAKAAAPPPVQYRYQYAAKVLCTANVPNTSQTTSSLLPGSYVTVVNIHNPNAKSARIRSKLALAIPPAISAFVEAGLKPDQAMKIDCDGMTQQYGLVFIHGLEGFLVIESTLSLDVVAVYTAGPGGGPVASIDVERVPERVLGR